jgi:replicative DNA helicase
LVQLQVLNSIINNKDSSLLLLNNLNEEFFSDYPNEFGFIRRHLSEYGKVPDMASFLDKFPDFEVLEVSEPTSYLLGELYKDRNTRFLAKTFNSIRKLLGEGKTDEAMRLYSKASEEMVQATPMETVDLIKDRTRFDDYVEKCGDFSRYYIRTGFRELDELIGGWDRQEELATIAARPGIGKSWILLVVAKAALEQGLRVGIYSGEMSERKVGYRFDTLVSHISNSAITRGKEYVQNEYRNYMDNLGQKFSGCLKVLTPAMISGPAGVTALRAFIEKENLDILCVDQHSLLEDDRNARNPVERAANISKDLKNLQVLKKIPIIAVSQQNRASTDNGVGTANIAQSDRISQDSTVILFIEQKDNVLTLNLAKARDAINNKKLHYAVDFDKGVFQFMPSEEDNPSSCEDLRDEYDGTISDGDDVF